MQYYFYYGRMYKPFSSALAIPQCDGKQHIFRITKENRVACFCFCKKKMLSLPSHPYDVKVYIFNA